jgi:hypothetical protein
LESRVGDWPAANPQHKHGVHRYRLDDFGLDPETVNCQFAAYRRWCDERIQDAPLRL